MVWTANRDRLVKENATLELTSSPPLGIFSWKDADGSLVWSTKTFTQDFQGIMMEESGNLVLLNNSNGSMWQSFDHPTDMILGGQRLKVGQKLTANISPTNTRQRIVYATILVNGFALYTAPAPPQMYFMYPNLPTALNVAYMQFNNESFVYCPESCPGNPITFSSLIPINSLYFEIAPDGHLVFYSFEQKTKKSLHDYLSSITDALSTCDYPITCGYYGICIDGQCSCPEEANAFTQIDASKPDLGCLQRSPLICPEKPTMSSTKFHQFLELDHVSYFSYNLGNASIQGLNSREECKALCLKNCSCKATFFRYYNISENYSSTFCYLESNVYTAYFKLQRNPKSTKRSVIMISISVVSGMVVLFLVSWVWIARSRKSEQKQRGDESGDDHLNLQTRFRLII